MIKQKWFMSYVVNSQFDVGGFNGTPFSTIKNTIFCTCITETHPIKKIQEIKTMQNYQTNVTLLGFSLLDKNDLEVIYEQTSL